MVMDGWMDIRYRSEQIHTHNKMKKKHERLDESEIVTIYDVRDVLTDRQFSNI